MSLPSPTSNRKVSLLEDATKRFPDEDRFRQSLERYRSRRDLVESIAAKAAAFENLGQFGDALAKWGIMRSTNPQYPGLDVEIDRVKRRRDQQRMNESKAQAVAQIDQALGLKDFARADTLTGEALAQFMNDPELVALRRSTQQGLKRSEEARRSLDEGLRLAREGRTEEAFAAMREANKLDPTGHPPELHWSISSCRERPCFWTPTGEQLSRWCPRRLNWMPAIHWPRACGH